MLAHVDLCSGIGGFALGFQRAGLSKPVLFCDIEPWSRQILNKHWPDVPIAEDVKELANDPEQIIKAINGRDSILTAGYPCQPFSAAGQRRGFEDDRHIWPEIFSIIQQVRPNWIVFENVSGHITLGLNQVLSDLADKANYSVQTFHIGAVSVDAPHRRMRLWIVGNRNDNGASSTRDLRIIQREPEWTQTDLFQSEGSSSPEGQGDVANANDKGIRSRIRGTSSQSPKESSGGRDHHEGSRANGGAQDSEKSQDIQEALANPQSKRDHASEANAQTSSQSRGLRQSGGSSSNNDVAYPDGFRRFQADKEMEGGSSELPDSMGVQSREESTDVLNANSKGSQGANNNKKSSRGVQQEPLQRCDDVANANSKHSRSRRVSEDSDRQGREQSKAQRESLQSRDRATRSSNTKQSSGDVANASKQQLKGRSEEQIYGERDLQRESGRGSEDASGGHALISRLGGMVDGLSTWLDEPPGIPRTGPSVKGRAARLKGLGNAIVPQIAERIGQTIKLIQLQGTKE